MGPAAEPAERAMVALLRAHELEQLTPLLKEEALLDAELLRSMRDLPACLDELGVSPADAARLASALDAPAKAKAAHRQLTSYQVDALGTKRGACPTKECIHFLSPPIDFNHCSGGGGAEALTCTRCGEDAAKHDDLGPWERGEPLLVNEKGEKFKVLRRGRGA